MRQLLRNKVAFIYFSHWTFASRESNGLMEDSASILASTFSHRNWDRSKINGHSLYDIGFITLHDRTWHDMRWHDFALHYIPLHYITLHHIALHYVVLHCIALQCTHPKNPPMRAQCFHYTALHYNTLHKLHTCMTPWPNHNIPWHTMTMTYKTHIVRQILS